MLSASEFTVGSVGQASPLTLVLPRQPYEMTMLVGRTTKGSAAVILNETHSFEWFETEGNSSWHGLLVPNVHIEVDLASVFSPSHAQPLLGSVVRRGTQLVLAAKAKSFGGFNSYEPIVLEDSLSSTSDETAGFHKWQVALGSGREKRILYTMDARTFRENSLTHPHPSIP